ncbi:MAG: hypothetical protein ACOYN2_03805 [Patescibacteria group bacterium]
MKIGELEMELAGSRIDVKRSDFLKDTNKLLKDFGSNKKVGSETDELKSKLKLIFQSFVEEINPKEATEKAPESKIDTSSYVYYKNLRELGIYKEKLREINHEILRAFFAPKDKKIRLALKKRLILQNIALIQNRIENKKFSYTRIVKGFEYYQDVLFYMVRSTADVVLYTIFFVGLYLLVGEMLAPWVNISGDMSGLLFPFTILAFFTLLFGNVRSLFMGSISSALFVFIIFALEINF